ncbi:UNVERIFIED_CONTAM: hypothetical protein K2H54_056952 [Gekko kuhli]
MVQVQKFVMNWGHLFQNDEQQVDYIAFWLRDGAADWWVLAKQYHLGLNQEICETVLHSMQPVSQLARMREATDAESRLKTIQIDNAFTLGKGSPSTPKPKTIAKPKEGVREQHMKQDLCLKCGEPGHFTTACLGPAGMKKGPLKVHIDTPAQKSTARPKTQRALQMSYSVKDLELSKNTEEEQMGKGQDLL